MRKNSIMLAKLSRDQVLQKAKLRVKKTELLEAQRVIQLDLQFTEKKVRAKQNL